MTSLIIPNEGGAAAMEHRAAPWHETPRSGDDNGHGD